MKERILSILRKGNFTSNFIAYIEENFDRDYKRLYNNPYLKEYKENPLNDHEPFIRLTESLCQLIDLEDFYKRKKIPISYFIKSIYDFNYRVERHLKEEGFYGLSAWDVRWLTSLFRASIFDIGSLRFQISSFSYEEIERSSYQYMFLSPKWKKVFPQATPIITIHILKDTDLSYDKVTDSLVEARGFFDKYFPEHKYEVFVCRTWLLYGKLRDILKEDSNILAFASRFKIIAENQNSKQALDRIYGTDDLEKIEKMEKKTSLEKIAYKNLGKLGVAAGIIYKEKL